MQRQASEFGIPGIWIAVLDVDPVTQRERLWADAVSGVVHSMPPGGSSLDPNPRIDSVHRVASISKLFTDTAAMVLVERGQLDLDAPIESYLPDFAPHNPYDPGITLRLLMEHRAGIVREPPVGHYFDAGEPSLAATVASLNDTVLVHAPGSAFKYSNPAIGVVGEVIAKVTGKPFEDAVRELVLAPLGLRDSDFAARPDLVARQAHGRMWTYDGRDIPTPEYAFGYGPAANLRSTTVDLVQFAASVFPRSERRVLRPDTQEAMWTLPAGGRSGCGLGYFVRDFEGRRSVGHDGAVYGFASSLRVLPDDGIAVAVVCTLDFANAAADDIADRALRAALANRQGATLPPPTWPVPVGAAAAHALAGHYVAGEKWFDLEARDEELFFSPNVGVRSRLRRAGDGALVADDVLGIGSVIHITERADGRLSDGELEYARDDALPPPCPDELAPYLGEYGWDHDVLIVYEDHGQLGVLIEWVRRDLVAPVRPDVYVFPDGMYGGDALRFERDADAAIVAVTVGGARFPRRPGPTAGTFRIAPQRPIAELQAAAAQATPPPQPAGMRAFDLVDLASLSPTLKFDIRYATADNFLGTAVYPAAVAKMQRPAAEALLRAHTALAGLGYGLCIHDAYRPWAITKVFWDATPDGQKQFVANPNPGSRHNRGCAVDLTLYELASGQVVATTSGYDEFTARAYPDYQGGTSRQRWYRELLRRTMEAEGFAVYEHEWWHFDFGAWRSYPIGNEVLR